MGPHNQMQFSGIHTRLFFVRRVPFSVVYSQRILSPVEAAREMKNNNTLIFDLDKRPRKTFKFIIKIIPCSNKTPNNINLFHPFLKFI